MKIRELVPIIALIMSIGGAVAYAHTQFAYKSDVVELRKMVYDLWKKEGFKE